VASGAGARLGRMGGGVHERQDAREGLAQGLRGGPTGEGNGHGVDEAHEALGVGGDDGLPDGAQGEGKQMTLVLGGLEGGAHMACGPGDGHGEAGEEHSGDEGGQGGRFAGEDEGKDERCGGGEERGSEPAPPGRAENGGEEDEGRRGCEPTREGGIDEEGQAGDEQGKAPLEGGGAEARWTVVTGREDHGASPTRRAESTSPRRRTATPRVEREESTRLPEHSTREEAWNEGSRGSRACCGEGGAMREKRP